MANLRDLLGIVTTDSIKGLSASDPVTKLPAYPSRDYEVMYITAQCGATCDGYTSNYGYYDYPDWKVPANTTEIIFEIWGGGGAGGAGCCCTRAVPGGSGAYAWKKLTGSQVVPGCSYSMEIAQPSARTGNSCGDPGKKTYITGFGLSNFCAEGGHGGCSCCFMCCCTWATLCCVCCNGPCALYYGADGGAYGNPGAGSMWCESNHCWNKQMLPYPGGLVNGKGGWLPTTQCADTGCGYCNYHFGVAQLGWGGSYSDKNYVPGVGAPSAWVCGGGCCYGQMGNPGMIRISYKQSEAGY